jgi:uncharacterized membrane protein
LIEAAENTRAVPILAGSSKEKKMVENTTSLPAGAGATTSDRTTGTQPQSGSSTTLASASSGTEPQTSYSSGTQAQAFSRQDYSAPQTSESSYSSEGRDLIVVEERTRPSTATIVGAAIAGAVVGGALPFMLSGRSSSSSSSRRQEDTVVTESVIVNKPARELYAFWREFTNLPQFMDNIKSVEKLDEKRSHWVIKAPAGTSVEFDSFVTEDIPGRSIGWQSEEGASVPNRGRVEFIETASGTGTNVRATISYDPPAGAAGRMVAKLFQREPSVQAREDLARFKRLMETGSANA